MATEKQIAANRANSLKSTGPITSEGKEIASLNAVTHGLAAKAVVISHGDGKENRGEFQSLYSELREDLRPSGKMEELLVERIVTLYWRQFRCLKAETGYIRGGVDTYKREYFTSALHAGDRAWGAREKSRRNTQKEIDTLTAILTSLENRIMATKKLLNPDEYMFSPEEIGIIYRLLFVNSKVPIRKEFIADKALIAEKIYGCLIHEAWDLERVRESAMFVVKEEIKSKEELTRIVETEDERQLTLSQQARSLPPDYELDRIVRYEGFLSKEIYRALSELERLQRLRRGMAVPPPITVNVQTAHS